MLFGIAAEQCSDMFKMFGMFGAQGKGGIMVEWLAVYNQRASGFFRPDPAGLADDATA